MRILIIHNNYGVYSGEEAVVDKQTALFRSLGYEVDLMRRDSSRYRDSFWGNLKGFFSAFYSFGSLSEIRRILKDHAPDLVIIHNLYPFISPAVLKPIKDSGIPIIMTVHNYRLICPTGLFMRDSRPCELCLHASEWNCIRYNCEHSFPKSVAYASRNWFARITKAYMNYVDLYACITRFQTEKLMEAGFDKQKMRILPNFMEETGSFNIQEGDYVAISGRLSREKGIELILKVAQRTPEIKYVFAGSKREGEVWKETIPGNCKFLGQLSKDELMAYYLNCKFLLIGSLCYEGFPMTILEAASYGKPAIGPGHAGFLEIIDNGITGFHFIPGDADSMERRVKQMWTDHSLCTEMGRNAHQKLVSNYTSSVLSIKWKEVMAELLPVSR